MVEDVSKRKRAEEALRKGEERYRSFIANSSEGIWRFEADQPVDTSLPIDQQIELFYKHGYLAECNDAMARMYGFSVATEIVGARLGDLLVAADEENIAAIRAFIGNGYQLQNVQSAEMDRNGRKRYFLNNVIGSVEGGLLLRAWGTQQDITDQKRADDEIRRSRQQLRDLAARLQSLREEERAHIARKIHDVLGQGLTGLKIDLAWLNKKLPDAGNEWVRTRMAERCKAAIELLDETPTAVKSLSTELRPSVLDTFGLSAAVEWQCSEFERRTGIACECRQLDDEMVLNAECSTALFRILQEALTNVARHSRATKVYVELAVDGSHVSLTVRDNGRGVTEDELAAPGSLGLLGMRERAVLLGGDFLVRGEPGKGSVVIARVPLDNAR
jgi:signal transduction histidine kinase